MKGKKASRRAKLVSNGNHKEKSRFETLVREIYFWRSKFTDAQIRIKHLETATTLKASNDEAKHAAKHAANVPFVDGPDCKRREDTEEAGLRIKRLQEELSRLTCQNAQYNRALNAAIVDNDALIRENEGLLKKVEEAEEVRSELTYFRVIYLLQRFELPASCAEDIESNCYTGSVAARCHNIRGRPLYHHAKGKGRPGDVKATECMTVTTPDINDSANVAHDHSKALKVESFPTERLIQLRSAV
eukprot:g81540.t1